MIGKTNAGASKTGAVKNSIITVTYPEGSDCTVSNGSRTFRAPDTSGTAAFVVPIGTWTVTATDGSRTKEQSVSITAKGQIQAVELAYELVVFDGEDNPDITGGWKSYEGPGNVTISGGQLILYGTAESVSLARNTLGTVNPIDLSSFSTITVHYAHSAGNNRWSLLIGSATKLLADGDNMLDISSVNDAQIIKFTVEATSAANTNVGPSRGFVNSIVLS